MAEGSSEILVPTHQNTWNLYHEEHNLNIILSWILGKYVGIGVGESG
jgi:hypothetical protein